MPKAHDALEAEIINGRKYLGSKVEIARDHQVLTAFVGIDTTIREYLLEGDVEGVTEILANQPGPRIEQPSGDSGKEVTQRTRAGFATDADGTILTIRRTGQGAEMGWDLDQ